MFDRGWIPASISLLNISEGAKRTIHRYEPANVARVSVVLMLVLINVEVTFLSEPADEYLDLYC